MSKRNVSVQSLPAFHKTEENVGKENVTAPYSTEITKNLKTETLKIFPSYKAGRTKILKPQFGLMS